MGAHLSHDSARACVRCERLPEDEDQEDEALAQEDVSDDEFANQIIKAPDAILQFTSHLYFVEEDEGRVVIDVMRLGSMKGSAACCFCTEDGSGKEGDRYEAFEGRISFEEGETQKSIEIQIIQSDQWAATLEFKVVLSQPSNCHLGPHLHTCRVKVIDGDTFPSSKYPEVGQGMEGIEKIGGLVLFWEYCKMNFYVEGIAWRTVTILLFDQMKNAYIYYKLSAVAYMLNTLFHDVHDQSFSKVQREHVATVIGLGYIVPMVLLHAWDLVRAELDIVGRSCVFLQQNTVRKYLNYSERSRSELANEVTDIQLAIKEDARDMAQGYGAVLSILKVFGKLIVLTYFLLRENPSVVKYVVLMPSLMVIFCCCRNSAIVKANAKPDELGSDMQAFVGDIGKNYTLIANYQQRPKINDVFASKSSLCRAASTVPDRVSLNNDYFTQWLGPVFVGIFVMTHARQVLDDKMGRGSFMATLGVFGEISGDFSEGYKEFMKIISRICALQGMTELLNRETDLLSWKKVNRARREATKIARDIILKQNSSGHPFPTDLIQFEFKGMGYSFPGALHMTISNVNLSFPQGSLVAINSKHGAGKQTLLRLIGHEIFPTVGEIFIPTHLRILPVSQDCFILRLSVLHNLTFGCAKVEKERIQSVLLDLAAYKLKSLVEQAFEKEVAEGSVDVSRETDESDDRQDSVEPSESESDLLWMKELNYTEKVKLHLARAFLMNPEVMVLKRPLLHFHDTEQENIMRRIQEHVRNRGLALPQDEEAVARRRPRTLFFSVENVNQARAADQSWNVVEEGDSSTVRVEERLPATFAAYESPLFLGVPS